MTMKKPTAVAPRRANETAKPPTVAVLASAISAVLGTVAVDTAFAQETLEEVTVTGSRIVRRDLTASSPVVSIETQQLEASSTIGVESVLNQMPQFVPQDTQFDTGGLQSSSFATPGIASLNLRGLGPNRNLVLVDGRRAQPANATLVIDVNTIPAAAIERIETITGGASAVYGADALAGVVNFILKDDFEGVEMDFQTSATAEGDGEETRFSSLIGFNADSGRGNVMLGVDWTKREAVRAIDREFFREGYFDPETSVGGFMNTSGYNAAGANAPSQDAVDAIFSRYGIAPGTVSRTSEFYFNPDGTAFVLSQPSSYTGPMNSTVVDGNGYTGMKLDPNGNLGQAFVEGLISIPLERRSAFGRATYDMTDNITAYIQANQASVETRQVNTYSPAITVWSAPIPADGMRSIPTDLQTLLDSRQLDPDGAGPLPPGAPGSGADLPWTLHRVTDFLGPRGAVDTRNVYQIMAGVEGRLPNRDLTWDVYVSTGETNVISESFGFGSLQRWQLLVAAPEFGVGTVTQGRNFTISCDTGLPIFRAAPPSANCIEGVEAKLKILTDLTQDIAEANVQGLVANIPGGEMRFAAGVSQRKNSFKFQPGEIADNVSTIENPIGLFAANNTLGSTEVSEIYGELLVPLTGNLDLELGYRLSDYDTVDDTVDTWKSLFNWRASDTVSIRGGFQFATRAPNTAELFTGDTLTVVGFGPSDPCSVTTLADWGNVPDNPDRLAVQQLCIDIIGNTTSAFGDVNSPQANDFARPNPRFFPLEIEIRKGNPTVGPEEAKTWTAGVVLTGPGPLENLVASFDFYNVEITDAIAPLNSLFVYEQCFNADGASNPTYSLDDPGGFCRLIGRNAVTGERAQVDSPFFNSGVLETAGLDVTVNWTKDLDMGSFYINSVVSILDHFDTQDNPTAPVLQAAGTLDQGGQYDYKLFTTFGFNFGQSSVGLTWRHLPSIDDETMVRNPNTTVLGVDSYNMFNLFARHTFNERFEFRGGIDNLLDEDPPVVGVDPGVDANKGTTRADYYDILGRRAYVGFKMSF